MVDSLSHFVKQAHAKPVVIVLDNGPIHRCQVVYDRQAEWEDEDVYGTGHPAVFSACLQPAFESDRNTVANDEVPLADESGLPLVESVEKSHLRYYQSLRARLLH